MKKTILILLLAATFQTVNAQSAEPAKEISVTYTVKGGQAEYFVNGKSVMKVVGEEITNSDPSLRTTSIKQCAFDKMLSCARVFWCDCLDNDITYQACLFAFFAECIKENSVVN